MKYTKKTYFSIYQICGRFPIYAGRSNGEVWEFLIYTGKYADTREEAEKMTREYAEEYMQKNGKKYGYTDYEIIWEC